MTTTQECSRTGRYVVGASDERPEHRARALVRAALDERGHTDLADAAELLVSELVTNAQTHGDGVAQVTTSYLPGPRQLLVEVTGHSATGRPRVCPKDLMRENGRGLLLVHHLADAWGTRTCPNGGGLQVWFRLRLPHQPQDGPGSRARDAAPEKPPR